MSTIRFDDRDTIATYAPHRAWGRAGQEGEHNETTTWTRRAGSTATVQFTGTRIQVYGTVGQAPLPPPASAYAVDDALPSVYQAEAERAAQFGVLFFDSGVLPPEPPEHTLTIALETDDAALWLDYFEVTPVEEEDEEPDAGTPTNGTDTTAGGDEPTPVLPTTSDTASSTDYLSLEPSIPTDGGIAASTAGPNATDPTLDGAGGADHESSGTTGAAARFPLGPVLGGVLGGIALLVLAVILFIYARKYRRGGGLPQPRYRKNGSEPAFLFPPSEYGDTASQLGPPSAGIPERPPSYRAPQVPFHLQEKAPPVVLRPPSD